MIGRTNGQPISITGLGVHVPARVLTNSDLSKLVDTNDEWILERTGISERRIAAEDEALTDICLPAARRALEMAAVDPKSIDLLVVATVTPDMAFPSSSALLADTLGMPDAAAYDLSAGCTGFVYAIAQAHAMLAAGLSKRALVVGGDVLSKILDWTDRSTIVLVGDGAGAGGMARGDVKMNGREVFKFATRVMVSSAEAILDECDKTVEDVDVYVPHQANVRIIDHAARKLGVPQEKTIVNVNKYGNTSSGSIPLALADAADEGRLEPGKLVLLTGMGAGLTWGSALIEWTHQTTGAAA